MSNFSDVSPKNTPSVHFSPPVVQSPKTKEKSTDWSIEKTIQENLIIEKDLSDVKDHVGSLNEPISKKHFIVVINNTTHTFDIIDCKNSVHQFFKLIASLFNNLISRSTHLTTMSRKTWLKNRLVEIGKELKTTSTQIKQHVERNEGVASSIQSPIITTGKKVKSVHVNFAKNKERETEFAEIKESLKKTIQIWESHKEKNNPSSLARLYNNIEKLAVSIKLNSSIFHNPKDHFKKLHERIENYEKLLLEIEKAPLTEHNKLELKKALKSEQEKINLADRQKWKELFKNQKIDISSLDLETCRLRHQTCLDLVERVNQIQGKNSVIFNDNLGNFKELLESLIVALEERIGKSASFEKNNEKLNKEISELFKELNPSEPFSKQVLIFEQLAEKIIELKKLHDQNVESSYGTLYREELKKVEERFEAELKKFNANFYSYHEDQLSRIERLNKTESEQLLREYPDTESPLGTLKLHYPEFLENIIEKEKELTQRIFQKFAPKPIIPPKPDETVSIPIESNPIKVSSIKESLEPQKKKTISAAYQEILKENEDYFDLISEAHSHTRQSKEVNFFDVKNNGELQKVIESLETYKGTIKKDPNKGLDEDWSQEEIYKKRDTCTELLRKLKSLIK